MEKKHNRKLYPDSLPFFVDELINSPVPYAEIMNGRLMYNDDNGSVISLYISGGSGQLKEGANYAYISKNCISDPTLRMAKIGASGSINTSDNYILAEIKTTKASGGLYSNDVNQIHFGNIFVTNTSTAQRKPFDIILIPPKDPNGQMQFRLWPGVVNNVAPAADGLITPKNIVDGNYIYLKVETDQATVKKVTIMTSSDNPGPVVATPNVPPSILYIMIGVYYSKQACKIWQGNNIYVSPVVYLEEDMTTPVLGGPTIVRWRNWQVSSVN